MVMGDAPVLPIFPSTDPIPPGHTVVGAPISPGPRASCTDRVQKSKLPVSALRRYFLLTNQQIGGPEQDMLGVWSCLGAHSRGQPGTLKEDFVAW